MPGLKPREWHAPTLGGVGWTMGIEPTTAGTTTRGSTTELRPPQIFPTPNHPTPNHPTPTFRRSTMARPAGLEPATYGLEGRCSIQLSYGRTAGESVSQIPGVAPGGSLPKLRLVGAAGFEPATLCSQSRCATRLRHAPSRNSRPAAGATERTPAAGARIIRVDSDQRQTPPPVTELPA
jgi:hypothetical protein